MSRAMRDDDVLQGVSEIEYSYEEINLIFILK